MGKNINDGKCLKGLIVECDNSLKIKKERIINGLDAFYNSMKRNDPKYHRYHSWEYCYKYFYNLFKQLKDGRKKNLGVSEIDGACLNLAFYLASWGMYRGSSFLLWKDYKVFESLIMKLFKEQYWMNLWNSKVSSWSEKEIIILMELKDAIKNDLITKSGYVKDTDKNPKKKEGGVTDTLITKILMGTLGCIPAFDAVFKRGVIKQKVIGNKRQFVLNEKNIKKILCFYKVNHKSFDEKRIYIEGTNICYPPMKKVDMFFWNMGN